jgi:polysaccharide chain length determinant protein (PEP-CTERM system associated)
MDEQGFSIRDIIAIGRRRLRVMLFTAGSFFLLCVVVAALLRDQYTVYTTILVEPQTISKKLVETGDEDTDVLSRLHLMTMQILSRARLSKVIDEFGLYPKESETMTREEVIDMMRNRIDLQPVLPQISDPDLERRVQLTVNTFQLSFRHDNPAQAAAVANRLANDYIDEHIKERVQSSGDTADFVDSELQRLSSRLREDESGIAKVKAENAGSLPDDLLTNQRQLERSFDLMAQAQQRLAEAQSDEAFYKQQATVARESGLANSSNSASAGVVSPTQRYQQLETLLGQLRGKGYTDKHPDVVATLAEMDQVRQRMGKEQDDPARDDAAPVSVAEQQAIAEAKRAALRIEAQQKEVARIQKDIDDTQARLANTPKVAQQLDGLTREHEQLTASYNDYSAKRLDAAVAANMERRQKGEQFRVLEPAYPPPDPTSPNRPLIIVLGAFFGIGAGAGLGLLLEASDSSFHDQRAAQALLRIPVLAAVPGILLDADRRRLRRRRIREAVAAATVTVVVLTGAVAGYVAVNRPNLFATLMGQQPAENDTTPGQAPAAAGGGTAGAGAAAPAPAAAPDDGDE